MRKSILGIPAILCALVLSVCLAVGDGGISRIWQSGYELLCATDNVTIRAHGVFTYDGEVFKTFDGLYKKQALRNYLQVDVITPVSDGSLRNSGYRVIGDDGTATAYEAGDPYYRYLGIDPSLSIVRSVDLKNTLRSTGTVVAGVADGLLGGSITREEKETGNLYTFAVKGENMPEVLQEELYPFLSDVAV